MSDDPLAVALSEIAPKLDPELQNLVSDLLDHKPIDESWQSLLQEILDEA